ncbi:MAG: monooxygenase [Rhodospirillaceae bacterium]|jgi:2-polyprenyl-6-methoxyphenol hydroxylase-like FAD-dependent oxidoreductase|nr:monooxygenase [Rhodospirillaceae bacterium]MBT4773999.1 monooxygenase [Rhodospirillaceae bacterium]MBT5358562.1 monooxygenase [Rhodospirillaceae bacterium]MBT5770886.1 monooxygenase [Rhodospirillaceae bacterium]MBT6311485.1 monooxygenase [Rhodospirillaceae bacterium]
MRIAIIGGGPAGLYFATLWKKRHPDAQVHVYEQNPADATFGFGVVFSDRALEFLRGDDPETHDLITPAMETWQDMTLIHRGETVTIDGVGFSSIGRLKLLQLMQERALAVGAELHFETVLRSVDDLPEADLIIAADGINSIVRRSYEGDFQTSLSYLPNKFAWYGVETPFNSLTQTFIETEYGPVNAHHYRYTPEMSTFLVECERETWERAGFATMSDEASRVLCSELFADTLRGKPLISNNSSWRNFPQLWSDRWSHLNMVLVGDALHTAHFSIGSGTRLAMEDVIALVGALEAEPGDIRAALTRYEAERRPIVEKIVAAATKSARWYEDFAAHMQLTPQEFGYSYMTRSGRVDDDRLRQLAPNFMADYEAAKA